MKFYNCENKGYRFNSYFEAAKALGEHIENLRFMKQPIKIEIISRNGKWLVYAMDHVRFKFYLGEE